MHINKHGIVTSTKYVFGFISIPVYANFQLLINMYSYLQLNLMLTVLFLQRFKGKLEYYSRVTYTLL